MIFRSKRHAETGPFRRIWQAFNALHDDLRHMEPHSSPTVRVHRKTSFGYTLEAAQGKASVGQAGATSVRRFQIAAIPGEAAFLLCWLIGRSGEVQNEADDPLYAVAKPPKQRLLQPHETSFTLTSPYTGQVLNFTAQLHLDPLYRIGDQIVATKPFGGTGVGAGITNGSTIRKTIVDGVETFVATIDDFEDYPVEGLQVTDDDNKLTWLDLNVDGRRWRMERRAVPVCENNQLRYQTFETSDPTTP